VELVELDRPVIVSGTPRSGKSCVWRLLRESREFVAVEEPLLTWDAGIVAPDDRRTADMVTDKIAQRIRRDCLTCVSSAGKKRYMDNLSHHSLRIGFVHRIIPEAKIIHVIREATDIMPELLFGWTNRDTIRGALGRRRRNLNLRALPSHVARFLRNYFSSRVSSRRVTWGPRVPGQAEFASSHEVAEIAAYQWSSMVCIALDDLALLPQHSVLEVRYDELVTRPREISARIAKFAEAADVDSVVSYAQANLRSDYVHHEPCRRELTDAQWEAVAPITRPVQERLGYL
jgi:hypothetical protein